MQAEMNIAVRIIARNVSQQISQIEKQLASLQAKAAMASGLGATNAFTRSLGASFDAMTKWGKNLQWSGRQLTTHFTLPILAAAAAGFKFAMDNQTAMAQFGKIYLTSGNNVGVLRKEMGLLQQGFVALSNIFGVNQRDVINIGTAWAEAGVKGSALAKDTRLTLETMVLGNETYQEASKSLIQLSGAYNLSSSQLKTSLQTMLSVFNTTSVSFSDLVTGVTRAGPAARVAGVDIQHLSAYIAALVPATGGAAQAGNALKTIFSRLFAPTKQASDALKFIGQRLGVDVSNPSLNAVEKLKLLAQGFATLTPAQKIATATFIGTRFQVSKLIQLLTDIKNPMGQYNHALAESGNAQKNAARYTQELSIYLSSQPAAFKILMTQLQNLLAKIILPLLPAILALAGKVASLVQSFTNLSPGTQSFILFGLAALAIIGPLASEIGSLGILVGVVGKAMLTFWNVALFGDFGEATKRSGALKFVISHFISWTQSALAGLYTAGIYVWRGLLDGITAIAPFIGSAMQAIADIAAGVWVGMKAVFSVIGETLAAAVDAGMAAAEAGFAAIGAASAAAFEAAAAVVAAGGLPLFIAAIVLALAALGIIFHRQIGEALSKVPDLFASAGRAVGDLLATMFRDGVNLAARALNQLPGVVVNVFQAVISVIASAAKAFYKWLSYLNPFAHHSPSLVENVTAGVDLIAKKYASLGNVGASFRTAVSDLRAYSIATQQAQAAQNFSTNRKDVAAADPGSLPQYDQLSSQTLALFPALQKIDRLYQQQGAIVGPLQRELDGMNLSIEKQQFVLDNLSYSLARTSAALDKHKTLLDKLVNTPIAGMHAMGEAIFANDMAQKKLNLDMLKIEQAAGGINNITNRMSELNGQIDLMTGKRDSLRLLGAGSDITGPIDAQIAALKEQRTSLTNSAVALDKLQKQLDKLALTGQILQAEQSLKFDPLTHQIQNVTNAVKEVPFAKLLQEIKDQQREVTKLTTIYNHQNAAVVAQQAVVDAMNHRKAAVTLAYDLENAKLTQLGTAYDAISQQIQDATSALDGFASAAKGKAGKSGAGGAGGALGGAGAGSFPVPGGKGGGLLSTDKANLDKLVKSWQGEINKSFGKIDLWKPVKDGAKNAWDWLVTFWTGKDPNPKVDPKKGPHQNDTHGQHGESFPMKALEAAGNASKALLTTVAGGLKAPFVLFWHWLDTEGHHAVQWLVNTFHGVPQKITRAMGNIVGAIADFFTKTIPKATDGIRKWIGDRVSDFSRWPGNVLRAIGDVGSKIWRFISRGFSSTAKDLWHWITQSIKDFGRWPGNVLRAIGDIGGSIWRFISGGFSTITSNLGHWMGNVITFFSGLPGRVIGAVGDIGGKLWGWISGGFSNIISNVWTWAGNIISIFAEIPSRLAQGLGNIGSTVVGALKSAWNALADWWNNHVASLHVHVPGTPFTISAPSLPRAALGGVAMAQPGGVPVLAAEAGHNEALMPLPAGLSLDSLNKTLMKVNKSLKAYEAPRPEQDRVVPTGSLKATKTVNFYGDLSFPNVTDGSDAEAFIRNIESMVD